MVLSDFSAGTLDLTRVVGPTRASSFAKFVNFLSVLETFGTGYSDDIDYKNYRIRDKESHRQSAIKQL